MVGVRVFRNFRIFTQFCNLRVCPVHTIRYPQPFEFAGVTCFFFGNGSNWRRSNGD